MSRANILFLTPFTQGSRGNVTTTLRMKTGYEQAGYSVNTFAYTETAT